MAMHPPSRAPEVARSALELVTRHEHSEALDLIAKAIEQEHGQPPFVLAFARAKALIGLERFGAAGEALSRFVDDVELAPLDRARARQLYVRYQLRTWGDADYFVDLARQAAEEAEKHGKDGHEVIVFARGDAAMGLSRKRARKAAETELAKAHAIVGRDARLFAFEASMCLDFDERVKARELYSLCEGLPNGGDRLAKLGMAHIARLAGDFKDAHGYLDTLGMWPKNDLGPRHERARLYTSEKRWRDAIAAFDDLISASPMSDGARWFRAERGAALYHAGNRDGALEAYRSIAKEPIEDRPGQSARRLLKLLEDPQHKAARKVVLPGIRTIAQLRDHCGPACCELYLGFFGLPGDQIEIARAIKLPNGGTPVYAMRQFLEAAGLEVRRLEADLPTMKKVLDLGLPLILEEEYSTSRHVAVAIGYDDERELLEVQDPMTHEIRETPYEALPRLLGLANNGTIIAYPKADTAKAKALDDAGVIESPYIPLVDEAWKAVDQNKWEEAEKLVEQAMSVRRDYELAWICRWTIARHFVETNARPAAGLEPILDDIVKIWPDDEWPQQYVGYHRYYAGRYEEALRAFEKARDRDDADGNNWGMIADCLIALGRNNEAVNPLYDTLRRMPSHTRAGENLADLLEQRGQFGRARVLNEVARELHPNNPFNWEVAARLCERQGDLDGALGSYDQSIQVAPPTRTFPRERRARVLADLGRIDDAVTQLKELGANDTTVRTKVELADLLYAHDRFDQAVVAARDILAVDANNASGRAILGAALAGSGKLDEGLTEMKEALKLRPAYAWVYAEMGRHLEKAGRALDAVEARAAAHGLNTSANNEFFLGVALEAANATQDAARTLRAAAQHGALDRKKLMRAAEIIAKAGSLGAARAFLDDTISGRREDPAPLAAQLHLLLEMSWAPRAAEPLLERVARLAPKDPWALVHRGRMLMARGEGDEAEGETLLRSAIEKLPGRAAKAMLAELLVARGRHDEALALLPPGANDFPFLRTRIRALLGLDRAQEAYDLVRAHEAETTVRTEPWQLYYLVASHVEEWAPALDYAEKLALDGGSDEGDSRLDYWEVEKFRVLLRMGEVERAIAFGSKQVGSPADAGLLAWTALECNQLEAARRFVELAQPERVSVPPPATGYRDGTMTPVPSEAGDPLALLVDARLVELAGDAPRALGLYQRAITEHPSEHAAKEQAARLLVSQGEHVLSLVLSEQAVGQEPLCSFSVAVRGQARMLASDRTGATRDLERAWMLSSPRERKKECQDLWAIRAALKGDRAESDRQRAAWEASSAPKSTADRERLSLLLSRILG